MAAVVNVIIAWLLYTWIVGTCYCLIDLLFTYFIVLFGFVVLLVFGCLRRLRF